MKPSIALSSYLRTYRALNLLMIAFTQFVVSHFIIIYYDFYIYLLISSSTIAIALAGYWLNDIADIAIDHVNNKQGLINESTKSVYRSAAFSLLFVGLLIGFYLSYITLFSLFWYFLLASFLVVFYAIFLSKYKVIGNVIVSFLIALVVLLCFYVALNHIAFTPKFFSYKIYAAWLYALAAFSVNWLREVIKDLEDSDGDKQANRVSLPTLFGVRLTSILVGFISLLFAVTITIYLLPNFILSPFMILLAVLLILFTCIAIYSFVAKEKKQFSRLSFATKLAMFIGLCLPIFY